ncbi:hypothetical protein EZI54_12645 [Marinobacter halodurans]|uniref:Uncharacterized protein n=1 Tax=Marinobacter halodurans TaxID=2528979 RepID=A0ABY1ZLV9_9GAMM|nr:hypothetical protein [Marinobacter halodurans]TBW54892.1 hypothetical protein EZI54_12645 [Marinobacter halodurans]
MRPDEFLKKYGFDEEDDKDHSLRGRALEHARHLKRPHAGTPHDWEDWERYRQEHPEDIEEEKEEGDR